MSHHWRTALVETTGDSRRVVSFEMHAAATPMVQLVFAILLIASALAQATVLPALGPIGILPNIVLVLLLIWSAWRGTREGLLWVFGIGIVLDLLALDALGTNGLALVVTALLAGPARRRFFHSGMVVPLLLTILATIVHGLVLMLLRGYGSDGALNASTGILRLIFLQALLNALLVPPVYVIASWTNRWAPEAV